MFIVTSDHNKQFETYDDAVEDIKVRSGKGWFDNGSVYIVAEIKGAVKCELPKSLYTFTEASTEEATQLLIGSSEDE